MDTNDNIIQDEKSFLSSIKFALGFGSNNPENNNVFNEKSKISDE